MCWVVAVTFAAAVTASVLFGTLPALHVSRAPIAGGLREGGRTMTAGPNRLRRGLVVAEIALALPLLLASVLAILGAHKFTSGWQGYEPDRLVKLRTVLPQTTYPDATARRNFAERLLAAAAAIPGATGVATASSLPSTMSNQQREYSIDGRPADPSEPLIAGYRAVSADYFPVMGIPILEGRGLNDRDRADGERVAVVNRAFANRYFADGTRARPPVEDRTRRAAVGDGGGRRRRHDRGLVHSPNRANGRGAGIAVAGQHGPTRRPYRGCAGGPRRRPEASVGVGRSGPAAGRGDVDARGRSPAHDRPALHRSD